MWVLQRIEHAAIERHQGDQQQVRESDPGQFDRESKARGIARESRREHIDHSRSEYQRNRKQHDLACEKQREDAIRKLPGTYAAALFPNAGVSGDKGRIEGAFCEDCAKVVGQAQRDKECVRHWTGTQDGRQYNVAGEAGDAGEQCKATDGENSINHRGSLLPGQK